MIRRARSRPAAPQQQAADELLSQAPLLKRTAGGAVEKPRAEAAPSAHEPDAQPSQLSAAGLGRSPGSNSGAMLTAEYINAQSDAASDGGAAGAAGTEPAYPATDSPAVSAAVPPPPLGLPGTRGLGSAPAPEADAPSLDQGSHGVQQCRQPACSTGRRKAATGASRMPRYAVAHPHVDGQLSPRTPIAVEAAAAAAATAAAAGDGGTTSSATLEVCSSLRFRSASVTTVAGCLGVPSTHELWPTPVMA